MYLCTDYHFNKLKNNTKMKKVQTLMLMLSNGYDRTVMFKRGN